MLSVHVCDVRKSFGNFEVLHGVTIKIEDGEFVVLVGPSGCGRCEISNRTDSPLRSSDAHAPRRACTPSETAGPHGQDEACR